MYNVILCCFVRHTNSIIYGFNKIVRLVFFFPSNSPVFSTLVLKLFNVTMFFDYDTMFNSFFLP